MLRFCLNDGSPLAEITESDLLWSEGETYIGEANRQVLRETRKRQFRTMLKTIIMMMLVIMIMSVITLQSWVYLNKPIEETAQKPSPTPITEGNPTETPTEVSAELGTPTPTTTPTPKVSPSPSPISTVSPSPTVSPSVSISPKPPKPPICDDRAMLKEKNLLEGAAYRGIYQQSVLNTEKDKPKNHFREKFIYLRQREFDTYPNLAISAQVQNCSEAKVSVTYSYYVSLKTDIDFGTYNGNMVVSCQKKNKEWKCA